MGRQKSYQRSDTAIITVESGDARRQVWLERLRKLIVTVKEWANELDWATRVIDKTMEDSEFGNYKAPALLLQYESLRLFLEPIAPDAAGTEGAVDLYLMPAYDDVASLFYHDNRITCQSGAGSSPHSRSHLPCRPGGAEVPKCVGKRPYDACQCDPHP